MARDKFKNLQKLWVPDCDYITIPEVVYPRNYDPKGDTTNDLVVHKLHLVYMIVFNQKLAEAVKKIGVDFLLKISDDNLMLKLLKVYQFEGSKSSGSTWWKTGINPWSKQKLSIRFPILMLTADWMN